MVNRYINCNGKYFANVKNLYITYVFLKGIFFFLHNLNIYLKINNFLLINNCHMYRSHVLNNYIRKFVTFDYSLWNDPWLCIRLNSHMKQIYISALHVCYIISILKEIILLIIPAALGRWKKQNNFL